MSVQVEKLEGSMAKLTIEVPADEFEEVIDTVYHKNKSSLSIPGFRKGKVPRKIIEQMYGKNIFYEEAANDTITVAYARAVRDCGEEVTSRPEINVEQIESGKPFIFTATVAIKPEVTLGEYKGIEVKKPDLAVTDEEVDAAIDEERERNARTVSVSDRAVKDGDVTVLDFEGFVDGEAFEGGKGENYPLTIGSGAFIPGFEEQLIGAEPDKELEVNVTFPEDYQSEELAGKAAVFKCTVREIKEKILPELDDEFAEEVSEFDTLAEYREDVRKNLEEKKAEQAKADKEDEAIKIVIENASIDIPAPMLEFKQEQLIESFARNLQMQGISIEQYYQITGLTQEALMEQVKPQAEENIRASLVLEAVAKAEKLEISDEDYNRALDKMAEGYGMSVQEVSDMIGEHEERLIKEDIRVEKGLEFIVENAVEK